MRRYLAVFTAILLVMIYATAICTISATPGQAAQDTDTPTPTIDPLLTVTPTPGEATPTPWVVVFVTATPHHTPPSLQIPDLKHKIKKGGLVAPHVFMALDPRPAYTTSPIPPEVDAAIATMLDWLIPIQRDYYAISGKYAQMLPSHSGLPSDGDHAYPDGWWNHPTDQQWSWQDMNAVQYEPLPFQISIDVYDGPEGPGFVTCYRMYVDGPYERCVNYGPESLRAHDWQLLE